MEDVGWRWMEVMEAAVVVVSRKMRELGYIYFFKSGDRQLCDTSYFQIIAFDEWF